MSTKNLSPIDKIHADGFKAIIDGDNQKIVDKCLPSQVEEKISELEKQYSDVGQDRDGDIVFFK